jgi:hypothetical protein
LSPPTTVALYILLDVSVVLCHSGTSLLKELLLVEDCSNICPSELLKFALDNDLELVIASRFQLFL